MYSEKNIKKRIIGNLVAGIIIAALSALVYLTDKVFVLNWFK